MSYGIPLDTPNRKLQAFLASAAATTNPTVTVYFYDTLSQTKAEVSEPKRAPQFTVLSGTTETDICAAPAQGTTRNIVGIHIYNPDTASVTVTVCIDDSGTNRILRKETLVPSASLSWTPDYGWENSGSSSSGVRVLAQSAVAVSGAADTAENTLATISIAGGLMAANDYLEIHTAWTVTNNANAKTARVRFSGISGTEFLSTSLASAASARYLTSICNVNSVSSQKGGGPAGGQVGTGATSIPTSSVNTALDTTLLITCQKGTAGDTFTLERYSVVLVKV